MSVATTVRIEKQKLDILDSVAKSIGKSRSWLLNKAIDDALEHHQWYVEEVQKGIDCADRGDFVSREELNDFLEKFGVGNDSLD